MDKVLWVKFGWSDYYRGGSVDGNFSYLAGNGNFGHEAYNFEPAPDGTYYCYVPPNFEVHAPSNTDQVGWTVVCLAKDPKRKGIHIVGWYENATLLGRWRDVPELCAQLRISHPDSEETWSYCITSRTAYFVPPEKRTIPFTHRAVRQGKYSYLRGPGIQATTNREEVLRVLKRLMKRLKSAVIENPTDKTAPDLGAEPGDPLRGFGTPEHRKKVEKAAEEAVKRHYLAKGFSHDDDHDNVTKKNLGFDLIFRKGRTEHHVEVKGTSGDLPRFFMTRNENTYRKTPACRFAIVTNALHPNPTICVYDNRRFKRIFELEPYVYTGMPVIMPKRL